MTDDEGVDRPLQLAQAAASLVGTPFRMHGRLPEFGLDCVGLVSAALRAIGASPSPPQGYSLRNTSIARWLQCAEISGLEETQYPLSPGDIVLVAPGPGQHHLLIYEGADSFIHAHAGIGKVSRIPAPLCWPMLKRWRLKTSQ